MAIPEWQNGKHGMYLYAPFNRDFTDAMKEMVPRDEREWDKVKKAWWISDAWIDDVDILLRDHFEDYAGQ
jgi:hypothetical protein